MKTSVEVPKGNQEIAERFSEAASVYHQKAEIQLKVAQGLVSSLLPWKGIIPDGPILEVGCGTGFVTEQLIKEFPKRELIATDLSEGMLNQCQTRLTGMHDNISFELLDVNESQPKEAKYSLIISNFAAQWFNDTAVGLERLADQLKPGGLLLCSFPGNHSFEEWYECCLELGLPYTANPLPDVEEVVIKLSVGPQQIDYYENDLYQEFESSMDFFKHLKDIGASHSKKGNALTLKQLKLLTDFWDQKMKNQVKVKWHIIYLVAKKD